MRLVSCPCVSPLSAASGATQLFDITRRSARTAPCSETSAWLLVGDGVSYRWPALTTRSVSALNEERRHPCRRSETGRPEDRSLFPAVGLILAAGRPVGQRTGPHLLSTQTMAWPNQTRLGHGAHGPRISRTSAEAPCPTIWHCRWPIGRMVWRSAPKPSRPARPCRQIATPYGLADRPNGVAISPKGRGACVVVSGSPEQLYAGVS